ncbi:hypothetical protein GY21_05675 [Cryobacterium roopkundense]|uniref:MFS family permease n=1 Tax=Cryobacterium roopkundense TaxID=1001240 RepID=A0A099JNT1_9MICO|nr:hypothetical protein [Cryobacterium roopkundense]KGJ79282.1 hypothetical protein GY21_05675 [Cryobacterium roopkundense]MBB5643669.1 MFS family permease [Cryobacterium roopkundense]
MIPTIAFAAIEDPDCVDTWIVCGAVRAVEGVGGAVNTAKGIADFWSDPAGNSFIMLQDAAKGLSDTVLPALTHATLPDLTADWFISAYRVSFALSIFVLVALLIPQIVRVARGTQSGRELGESLTLYAPAFMIGAAFGPALGAFLVRFFGALSDSLIAWGVTNNSQSIVEKFSTMLSEDDGSGLAGGAVLGVILMFFMILGLLIVLLILVVQLITLYFSGVLFPLGFVWIVDPKKRAFGSKIVYLWFGVLASHPLLFFLLAIAYSMMTAQLNALSDTPSLQKTVTLVVSILALFMAGLAPVALTKFAPIIPSGGIGNAPTGPNIGAQSMQEADAKYDNSGGSKPSTGDKSSSSSDDSDSSPVTTGGKGSPVTASSEGTPATSSISEAASIGGKAGAGASTAGAGAAGRAAAAEGGLAAAGAAESSTGVGAAIGIPTMLAAGAMASFDATKKVTDSVSEAAVSPVDDEEAHYGKDSTHE